MSLTPAKASLAPPAGGGVANVQMNGNGKGPELVFKTPAPRRRHHSNDEEGEEEEDAEEEEGGEGGLGGVVEGLHNLELAQANGHALEEVVEEEMEVEMRLEDMEVEYMPPRAIRESDLTRSPFERLLCRVSPLAIVPGFLLEHRSNTDSPSST